MHNPKWRGIFPAITTKFKENATMKHWPYAVGLCH
jgi:hypothetical protein